MAADGQRFCLKWNDFRNSVTAVFEDLRQDEELVDITLCCEGKKVKAHRMMLSACSPYFRELLKENPCQHPVFFLKDTTFVDLKAVIQFVYNGEVNVTQGQLSSFLKTAEMLQVRGLTGDDEKESTAPPPPPPPMPLPRHAPPPVVPQHVPAKRPVPSVLSQRVVPPMPAKRPLPAPAPAPTPPKRPAPLPAAHPDADVYVEPVIVSDSPPPPPPERAAASPAAPRRHRSGSSGGPATPAGSEPSADAAPSPADGSAPPPPPPPPPLPPLTPATLPPPDVPPLPLPPGDGRDMVKVEKVDIADDDDDVSLEAALGQVVNYEGSYDSDQSMSGLLQADLSQGSSGLLPGTSDGGAGSGSKYRRECPTCLKTFGSASSLYEHRLTHEGLTNCPVCGKFLSRLSNLRRHMESQHQIPKDQLDTVLAFRR